MANEQDRNQAQSVLRIGTRKSPLALWQAEHVQALLGARGHTCELLKMSTQGDQILDRSLAQVGGKGLFVKELEEALADGRADLAVHSAKDVPFSLPAGFGLCAFPEREDPRDALVAPRARTFANLPRGARVGTSSLRRAVQLLAVRPDLEIVPVRGNVATRLSRATGVGAGAKEGQALPEAERLDAVILALAGLVRLGLDGHVTEVLPVELSLPAAGQGALAIEALTGSRGEQAAAALDQPSVARRVRAERAVLHRLAGSCTVPIAAHAVEESTAASSAAGGTLWLRAALGGPAAGGGVTLLQAEARGPADDPERLGVRVAELLLEKGGGPLLEAARLTAGGLPAPKRDLP
jgi:hydroxymethylbilane synthase